MSVLLDFPPRNINDPTHFLWQDFYNRTRDLVLSLQAGTGIASNLTVPGNLVVNGNTNVVALQASSTITATAGISVTAGGLSITGGSFSVSSTATANSFIPTSNTVPVDGIYLPGTHSVGIATNTTLRMGFESDGRVYFKNIHNNGTVTGTANHYLASGTYTPSVNTSTNVSSNSIGAHRWIRLGRVVVVWGKTDVTPTSASTDTKLNITLPIASTISAASDVIGVGVWRASGVADVSIACVGDTGNNGVQLELFSPSTSNSGWWYSFSYVIN
jgi:hypothetical protein